MAIDLSGLTAEELLALANQSTAAAAQKKAAEELAELEESEGRRIRISEAVSDLTALIGPENSPPYIPGGETGPSIRGLLAYSAEDMAANAGIALRFLYEGLEQLALTTKDIAESLSTE